jgi:hypothetical protein
MNNLLKILFIVICFLTLQHLLELIFMSILAKLGVAYMNLDARGENFEEIVEGIAVYYFYTMPLYLGSAYILLMVTFLFYRSRKKELGFSVVAFMHIIVTLILFLVLWFVFGNGFETITNPLLSLLLAGLVIYYFASRLKKPLIQQKDAIVIA